MVGIMMAALGKGDPAFVSYEVGGDGGGPGTSLSISTPSDAISSDIHLAFYGANNPAAGRTWSVPSQWTERLDQGARPSIGVATASVENPGTNWTISSASSGGFAGIRMRFRTAIYDAIGTVASTTSNGTLSLPGITASRGLLLACIFVENGDTLTAPGTTTVPTGFSTIYDDTPAAGTNKMRISIFSKAVTAGATGDIDTTIASIGTGAAAGVLIGLA